MLRTVRARLALVAALAVSAVLIVVSLVLLWALRHSLTEHLDQELSDRVDEISSQIAAGTLPTVLTGLGDDDTLAQVVDADGRAIAASATAQGLAPLGSLPATDGDQIRTMSVPTDDATFRLLSRRVDTPRGAVAIHVAASRDDVDEAVRQLARWLAVVVPFAALALALLVWWLAGRALRPVEVMRTDVERMSGADLHERIVEPDGDDEIARLARTLNLLLARIESAAARQQQFVGDASHELRSPLARMRAELEVDLAHPSGADPVATHRSVLDEVIGMQHLVDDLLQLAAADAGKAVEPQTVDLAQIVRDEAGRLADGTTLGVHTADVEQVSVTGNGAALARVVHNLADNAQRHALANVWFELHAHDQVVVLSVADDGPGIPPQDRERVLHRFARLDEARSAADGGTGLGLAIALAIVQRHGGELHVEEHPSGGARVVMTLPLRR